MRYKFYLAKYPKRFSRAKRKLKRAKDSKQIIVFNEVFNDPYMTTVYDEKFEHYIIRGAGKTVISKIPASLTNLTKQGDK